MARISLPFLLTALYLANGASAVTSHPGADVLGFDKRAPEPAGVGRVGHAGTLAAPSKPAAVKRHRRAAKGAKRAVDPVERSVLDPVPAPEKRDLNTPSSGAGRATLMLERAHPGFGETGELHPQVFLQQHINRGVRRHAKMTGRDLGDLDSQFEDSIRKRWVGIHGHDDGLVLRKRQRVGHVGSDKVATGNEDVDVNGFFAGGDPKSEAAAPDAPTNEAANNPGFSQADLKALEQNTITKANPPTAQNSIGLDIESADVGYFATVKLGTPGTNFKILMDSGSADFWVPSENCKSCGKTHQALGQKVSSSFQATQKPFQVTYGTGAVAGAIIQDTVDIAGLKLDNHTFGATTQETQDFGAARVPFDGLMGLAISTLSNQKVPTPIESLANQKAVQAPQMGFALGRVADKNNVGEITFGGVDQTKFNGQLTLFANVNKQGFWEGAMADVAVNGKSTGLQGRTAILDTGTTLIVAPAKDAQAIHAAIPGAKSDGQGGFTVPCTTNAQVSLSFGGKAFNIDPRDLAFQPLTRNLKGDCVSGISAGQIGGAKEWLVGDVFLKSVYFATDVQNKQIGLAQRQAA